MSVMIFVMPIDEVDYVAISNAIDQVADGPTEDQGQRPLEQPLRVRTLVGGSTRTRRQPLLLFSAR